MTPEQRVIEEFCERHRACREGSEWALASCRSMADVWDTAKGVAPDGR